MAIATTGGLLDHFRKLVKPDFDGAVADGELLRRFRDRRDPAAFEAMVRRHGTMVYNVCRRVLGDHHDAEDAFQAAFLVLARKADAIRPGGMVGNWLYGVAFRTALNAKSMIAKRRSKEDRVKAMAKTEWVDDSLWNQVQPALDEELHRLPDDYRAAIVMCDLEGKTRKEAARELGWLEGTLSGRLSRARQMLAKRLSRRGITLAGGMLAMLVSDHAAQAAPPAALVSSTVRAGTLIAVQPGALSAAVASPVAAMTQGVLRIMFLAKLQTALTAVVAIIVVAVGGGALMQASFNQPASADLHAALSPISELETAKPPVHDLNKGWMIEPSILFNESVIQQAAITDEQLAKVKMAIDEVKNKHRNAVNEAALEYSPDVPEKADNARRVFKVFEEDWKKAGTKILETEFKPEQIKRIREIDLQWRGPLAFHEDHVVKSLRLTEEQQSKLEPNMEVMKTEFDKQVAEMEFGAEQSASQRAALIEEARRNAIKRCEKRFSDMLSKEQRNTWNAMLGEPLNYESDGSDLFENGDENFAMALFGINEPRSNPMESPQ